MTETLFHTYTPLILWTGLGVLLFRFIAIALPRLLARTSCEKFSQSNYLFRFIAIALPRLLARALYWVGVLVVFFL